LYADRQLDVLRHAFLILVGDISRSTEWSTAAITAALSVSQFVAALTGTGYAWARPGCQATGV
jgi:hypothetical protein